METSSSEYDDSNGVFQFVALHLDQNEDSNSLRAAVTKLRVLSSVKNNKREIEEIFVRGYVPRLIELMGHEDDRIVHEVCWILANVSVPKDYVSFCVKNGIIDGFLQVLDKFLKYETWDNETIRVLMQPVLGLGNIAIESISYRNLLLEKGVMSRMLSVIDVVLNSIALGDDSIGNIGTITWALTNIMRGDPDPNFVHVQECLPFLARLIYVNSSEIIIDVLWCFSYITRNCEYIPDVLNLNITGRIMQLILNEESDTTVYVPACRILGNISTGSHRSAEVLLDTGILDAYLHLIHHNLASIRREVAWGLSNLAAGLSSQLQQIIDSPILVVVLDLLSSSFEDDKVKRECLYVILNSLSTATPWQIKYLSKMDCAKILIEYIDSLAGTPPTDILMLTLNSLYTLLKEDNLYVSSLINSFGGREILEAFMYLDAVKSLREKIVTILDLIPELNCVNWSTELHSKAPEDIREVIKTVLIVSQIDSETGLPLYPSEDDQIHFWYLPKEIIIREIFSKFKFQFELEKESTLKKPNGLYSQFNF